MLEEYTQTDYREAVSEPSRLHEPKNRVRRTFLERIHQEVATGKRIGGHHVDFDYSLLPGNEQSNLDLSIPNLKVENLRLHPEVETRVQFLRSFITNPLLEDYFDTDDQQRDAWGKSVLESYGYTVTDPVTNQPQDKFDSAKATTANRILSANRYRVNDLGFVLTTVDLLADPTDEILTENQIRDLADIRTAMTSVINFPGNIYKMLPKEVKKKVVSQYTMASINVMQVLAGRELASDNLAYMEKLKQEIEKEVVGGFLELLAEQHSVLADRLHYILQVSRAHQAVVEHAAESQIDIPEIPLNIEELNQLRSTVYLVVSYLEKLTELVHEHSLSLAEPDRHMLFQFRAMLAQVKASTETLSTHKMNSKLNALRVFLDRVSLPSSLS